MLASMASNDFHILEHPADIGISARGDDYAEAYANAARGLFSLIVNQNSVEERSIKEVHIEGDDREHLLVRWLSELLYLYDGEKFVISEVEVQCPTPTVLRAMLKGETLDANRHSPKLDVKAITYHQLEITEQQDGTVEIQFIVDI